MNKTVFGVSNQARHIPVMACGLNFCLDLESKGIVLSML